MSCSPVRWVGVEDKEDVANWARLDLVDWLSSKIASIAINIALNMAVGLCDCNLDGEVIFFLTVIVGRSCLVILLVAVFSCESTTCSNRLSASSSASKPRTLSRSAIYVELVPVVAIDLAENDLNFRCWQLSAACLSHDPTSRQLCSTWSLTNLLDWKFVRSTRWALMIDTMIFKRCDCRMHINQDGFRCLDDSTQVSLLSTECDNSWLVLLSSLAASLTSPSQSSC